jgi:hypothetical protein
MPTLVNYRFSSATNSIIGAQDHASVQINVASVRSPENFVQLLFQSSALLEFLSLAAYLVHVTTPTWWITIACDGCRFKCMATS